MTQTLVPGRRRWWMAAAVCAAAIAIATLSPEPESMHAGSWRWSLFDFAQNVVLFAPLGASLLVATRSRTKSIVWGATLSLMVELLQLHVIPGRDASLSDWIANTLGTLAGTVLVAFYIFVRRRRS